MAFNITRLTSREELTARRSSRVNSLSFSTARWEAISSAVRPPARPSRNKCGWITSGSGGSEILSALTLDRLANACGGDWREFFTRARLLNRQNHKQVG